MVQRNIFKTRFNRYLIRGIYAPTYLLLLYIIFGHAKGGTLSYKQIYFGLLIVVTIYFFLFLFRCPKCNWKTMRKTSGQDNPFIMPKECTICKFEYIWNWNLCAKRMSASAPKRTLASVLFEAILRRSLNVCYASISGR